MNYVLLSSWKLMPKVMWFRQSTVHQRVLANHGVEEKNRSCRAVMQSWAYHPQVSSREGNESKVFNRGMSTGMPPVALAWGRKIHSERRRRKDRRCEVTALDTWDSLQKWAFLHPGNLTERQEWLSRAFNGRGKTGFRMDRERSERLGTCKHIKSYHGFDRFRLIVRQLADIL